MERLGPLAPWAVLAAVCWSVALGSAGAPSGAASQDATPTATVEAPPTPAVSAQQDYLDWLQAHQQRQLAVVQAIPSPLDLGDAGWRRDLALAVDSWGALIQQARDQHPPPGAQALHRALLDALDYLDQARRLLLIAAATGEEPGPEFGTALERGRRGLLDLTQQARALANGGRVARTPTAARGNLRVTVLGLSRPYVDRGVPADPAFEYVVVRLRLESIAGEPVVYDAFQFRLRAADQTLHPPVAIGVPDELLYGALEGNRLAGEIVGNLAFPVRKGVPAIALFYAPDQGEPPVQIPLGSPAAIRTPSPTPDPGAGLRQADNRAA